MKTRILTSVGIMALILPVIWLSDLFVYPLLLSLAAAGAMFELFRVIGQEKNLALTLPAYLLALAAPVGAFVCLRVYALEITSYLLYVFLAFTVYLLYTFALAVLAQGELSFGTVATAVTATEYIVGAFTAMSVLLQMKNGIFLYACVFLGAWITDVFAYFTGYFFGKHKLIPKISPKKTVEGSVGGIVFAVLAFLLYGYILTRFGKVPKYGVLAVLGLVLSVISQIGDLIASLIKREHGIKDYGKLFPGHGGILDRFDSIIAVATVLLAVCLIAPPIG